MTPVRGQDDRRFSGGPNWSATHHQTKKPPNHPGASAYHDRARGYFGGWILATSLTTASTSLSVIFPAAKA